MCWFLTDKFIACWLQIYFQNWCWCHSPFIGALSSAHPSHLLTNKKFCRQPNDHFFLKLSEIVFLLGLLSLFIVVPASCISEELPDPRPKFYMISQPTQLPLTVRPYWTSVQAMGLRFLFSVQNTVQSEWWPVQQFFRLLTYCCSYLSKILIMKLCH